MILLSSFARNSCPLTVLLLLLGAHISSMSVRLILLLNLCMIRMASIIYRGHLVLFGIDCAYPISARPLHDFGVFPEIHPYCTVGFCWVRLWLPTSSRTISRRRLSISVMIFRISFMILRQVSVEYKMLSTTECRFQRMESAASHRLWTLIGILWRTRSVIINNVWRSWYFEYFLP